MGGALHALQQRSGRTLRSLEEQVRIGDSSLSRYFLGDSVPPWPVVRDVCQALGGDPSEFWALWEAADGTRPEAPAGSAGSAGPAVSASSASSSPSASASPSAVSVAPVASAVSVAPSASGRVARLRARLPGRWAYATVGAVGGLLAGVVVAVLALPSAPPGPAGTAGSAASAVSSGRAPVTEGSVRAEEASADASKPPEATRIFVSRATGNCLDDSLDKGLRSYACNGMPYQWWTVNRSADGSRQLRNHATGKCLDHGGDGLRTVPCGADSSQWWVFVTGGDEAVGLRNEATGRCLADHRRPGLRAMSCAPARHQKWA
ncbi:hypothetical protein GCM10010252_74050 [Streptomyces aureoverticillatus]|nr:hypothetical protein GCM10010252_74050 [Streptomyces aureoverticillatus]